MELMDWKEIETGAENAIRQAERDTAVAKILYAEAVKKIKKLGGKTNFELDKEAKDCSTEELNGITG